MDTICDTQQFGIFMYEIITTYYYRRCDLGPVGNINL